MGAGCTCGACGHPWSSRDTIFDPILDTIGKSGPKRGYPPQKKWKILYVTIYFSVGFARRLATPFDNKVDLSTLSKGGRSRRILATKKKIVTYRA